MLGQNAEEDLQKLINLIKNNFGEEKPLPGNLIKEKFLKVLLYLMDSL